MSYNNNNSPTSPNSRPPSRGAFLNLPEMSNPKEQTLLWQQNSYMSDSGIQSGESTHAPPTLCGKEDDLEDPMGFDDWDPSVFDQSFPQEQVDDLNLQLNGPQFPDSLEQDIEVPQFDLPQPTAGQQVAEPAQVSDTFNLDNLQDDVDLATRLIPALVSLLQEADDQVVVSKATEVVRQLLHREVSQLAMVRCAPHVARAMVRVCGWSSCLDTVKGAAKVLFFLSHHPEGHQAIYAAGGVPMLITALASPMDSILFCAISTLHNLLLHQDGAKAAVCAAGGLQILLSLLKRNNVKFLTIVMDCLKILANENQNNKVWAGGLQMVVPLLKINNVKLLTIVMECLKLLAHGHPDNKMIILQSGGSVELIRIMQRYNLLNTEKSLKTVVEKLLWTTAMLIKVLSVCPNNKQAILKVGGMQALATHLGAHSPRLVINCLWALRNLSDAATCESNIDGLLQGLVQLMSSSDVQVVTCSAGILSNMTCNNQHNKVSVCRAGGVDALIRALQEAGGREEITEPAVCALRHLMSRHPEADLAKNTVRLNYGIQVIVKLLHPPSSLPLIKAVIGLIRNLAQCPANSALLREHGAIPRLVQLLFEAYHASLQGGPSSGVSEVRMEKILEGVLSAFQMLARDPHNRALIHKFNVLPLLEQLLGCNVECVRSMAEKVLWAFAAEDSGPPSGMSSPPLMEMLSPPPMDRPESCAAGSLFRMPENKADDKKQFSIEPASSIFTDDSGLWSGLSSDIDMSLLGSEEAYPGTDIHMMGPEETFNDPMYPPMGPPHPGYEAQEFDPLQGYEADFKWFEKKN